MCNLVAVKSQTQPGDAIVADWMAHIIRAESGGAALASGVRVEPIQTDRGVFSVEKLKEALGRTVTVPPPYGQRVRLVCVEQTHNFGGGAVWSLDELRAVSGYAREHQMLLHMDGARLLNACVATGIRAADFSATVDSVWIDFTKGLGAPIGAVLAGTKEFMCKARRYKQLFGGAMRQAGIAAAGCLYAMDHHVDRLAEDHEHAKLLADGLLAINGIHVHTPTPETNMVFFDVQALDVSNERFVNLMAASGVRVSQTGRAIRAVTHLDVSRNGIDRALDVVRQVATKC
jgi:threonine aldolase